MKPADMNDEQYGLLTDVRRSIRYHDRRRGFFDLMHRMTSVLTVFMAGVVLTRMEFSLSLLPWSRWLMS
jgi:hypothetical protein